MNKILDLLVSEADEKTEVDLLEQVSKDAALADEWERYHLVGAVMRKEHHHYEPAFSERVRAQIEAEPSLLAPNNLAQDYEKTGAGSGRNRGLITTLAIAASIAAITVIGLPLKSIFDDSTPSSAFADATNATRWQTKQPEFESRLNEFLVEHGEFSTASNMNGLIAYAKFVSYDSSR